MKLLVTNLPENCSEDNLQNYFESKRKFGTELEVKDVRIFEDDDAAIVTFDDSSGKTRMVFYAPKRNCGGI